MFTRLGSKSGLTGCWLSQKGHAVCPGVYLCLLVKAYRLLGPLKLVLQSCLLSADGCARCHCKTGLKEPAEAVGTDTPVNDIFEFHDMP